MKTRDREKQNRRKEKRKEIERQRKNGHFEYKNCLGGRKNEKVGAAE